MRDADTVESAAAKKGVSYRDAGVDRVLADKLVDRIKTMTGAPSARTKALKRQLRSTVGGYASLYEISKTQWLAASTDGVGTKLKLAFELGIHDTVGIDLVAMSVNDLLCVGARPLFFLDYLATGKLELEASAAVIRGVQAGCEAARVLLVGGETAEMPGMYQAGEYDLAGFAVGLVHPKKALPRSKGPSAVKPGLALVGLRSSGFHSNGFSLLRRLADGFDPSRTKLAWAKSRQALLRELLVPTTLYTDAILPAVENGLYAGLAHITGSGFLNVPRISEKVSYEIELPESSKLPRAYEWLAETGAVTPAERLTTFNCGVGMVGAVKPKDVKKVISMARKAGIDAWVVGETIPRRRGEESEVHVTADGKRYTLAE